MNIYLTRIGDTPVVAAYINGKWVEIAREEPGKAGRVVKLPARKPNGPDDA